MWGWRRNLTRPRSGEGVEVGSKLVIADRAVTQGNCTVYNWSTCSGSSRVLNCLFADSSIAVLLKCTPHMANKNNAEII